MNGQEIYQAISSNINIIIKGQEQAIRMLLAAFISGGHVLLEDVPRLSRMYQGIMEKLLVGQP